jgi:hypothetical protein
VTNDLITAEQLKMTHRSNRDLLDALWMSAADIGRVLNERGSGRCPWCHTGGPMTVGEFGVVWLCGHARRIPELHTPEMAMRCPKCNPPAQLRAVA